MDRKILVVDDEEFNREDIEEDLIEAGYAVRLVDRGAKALELLTLYPKDFHAVLLDRMMPGMSGMEVLQEIKKNKELQNVPIIFQTAKASRENILEGMKAGAYYYLSKPFTTEELLSVIKAAVLKFEHHIKLTELSNEKEQFLLMLSTLKKGRAELRTLEEVCAVAHSFSFPCADSGVVKTVLLEMLVNAVEHGNLGITYDEKSQLLEDDCWEEELERRLTMPQYSSRVATFDFEISSERIYFRIEDEGKGFDWTPHLEFGTGERIFHNHGRGIAICHNSSDFIIQYHPPGNVVEVTWTSPLL